MLNKVDIIEYMNHQKWNTNEYWICSGAALVLHEVKQFASDIDIGCTTSMMDWLILNNIGSYFKKYGRAVRINETIEIFENWNVDEIININGLPVASLVGVKKQKQLLGRKKDEEDIQLIDKFLKENKEFLL